MRTSMMWEIRVHVRHASGIFKRTSVQYYTVCSAKPIDGHRAIETFKKQHPHGSRVDFVPRTPRQKHASRVIGAYGFVDYTEGVSANAKK